MVLKRAKCNSNGVKIAIFAAKSRKSPTSWAPSVTRLSSNGLFSTGPKLDNFCAKKHLLLVQAPSLLLNKTLVAHLVAFTPVDRFFKRLYRPHAKRANKRCQAYMYLFSKWIQNCSFKISVFLCKSSVHFRLGPSHFLWSGDGTAGRVCLSHS